MSDEKEKAETPAPEPECLCLACAAQRTACAAQRTGGEGLYGFSWLIGFAEGVRVAQTGADALFCEEHMTDLKMILEEMGLAAIAVESGEGGAPS